MDFLDLLRLTNEAGVPLDGKRQVKLLRHRSPSRDLEKLRRLGFFEDYQSRQSRDVFAKTEYILSFMGESGARSRFLGAYKVGQRAQPAPPWPDGYPYPDMEPGGFWYDLSKVNGFEELEDRLIVDWGTATRSWHQWITPKAVLELLPKGHARAFPGYLDFILEYEELEQIIRHPDANRIWHTMLKGVAGVYLITDAPKGDLYVGSAYGKDGILGRWTAYTKSKHGGNKLLKSLLAENPDRYRSFTFSILRTLPRTLTDREVIEVESHYKKKLGSRSFGLNSN